MTPEEAAEIDRLEFEQESARLRQMAFDMVSKKPLPPVEPELAEPKLKLKRGPKPKPRPPKPPRDERPRGERLTAHGLSLTRAEWADHLGITIGGLFVRLKRHPLEEALMPGKRKPPGRPPRSPQPDPDCPVDQ